MSGLPIVCQFWKRWAPTYDEDIISKIVDMRPISIKTHGWIFVKNNNMVPISVTKHKTTVCGNSKI